MPRKMILPDRPLTGAERQARWKARQDAAVSALTRRDRRHAQALKKITQASSLKEAHQLAEWALLD